MNSATTVNNTAAEAADLDHYPTRIPRAGALPPFARTAPVVRGCAADVARAVGRSNAAARFEADGFLSVPGFFPAGQAAAWRAEAERLRALCMRVRPTEAFFERDGGLRSLFDVTSYSQMFNALACSAPLV